MLEVFVNSFVSCVVTSLVIRREIEERNDQLNSFAFNRRKMNEDTRITSKTTIKEERRQTFYNSSHDSFTLLLNNFEYKYINIDAAAVT
ncbi:hypothetical protein [Bacillus cereus]|uniref:hypothetical protein n=1 Tax=Bacillus cereus TaxID=1396 RepID=UPI001145E889|nr:hypothetical protein [Bacillus cereus]